MRFLKYLKEEFAGSRSMKSYGKGGGGVTDVEFFVNPTLKEISIAYKASGKEKCIRFFADYKRKEVIIWEGGVLHLAVTRLYKKRMEDLFCGTAEPSVGKMKVLGSDLLQFDATQEMLDDLATNKKWLSKYFININEILKRYKAD